MSLTRPLSADVLSAVKACFQPGEDETDLHTPWVTELLEAADVSPLLDGKGFGLLSRGLDVANASPKKMEAFLLAYLSPSKFAGKASDFESTLSAMNEILVIDGWTIRRKGTKVRIVATKAGLSPGEDRIVWARLPPFLVGFGTCALLVVILIFAYRLLAGINPLVRGSLLSVLAAAFFGIIANAIVQNLIAAAIWDSIKQAFKISKR